MNMPSILDRTSENSMISNKASTVREDIILSAAKAIEEASLIVKNADHIKLFLPGTSRQSCEAKDVLRRATVWIKNFKGCLKSYSVGEALKLTDAYDLMHRISFNLPADKEYINRIILRAFDAIIHGSKDVDEYILFKLIERRVQQREQAFLDRPLTWICQCLDKWHKEAVKGFDSFELSNYDILSRVNILLDSDLSPFEGRKQKHFKQTLFECTRHYLDNYDASDAKTQSAIEQFLYASAQFLTQKEFDRYHRYLITSRIEPVA